MHELFATQARRTPDRVALIAHDTRLTYRELAAESERLAARLLALGIGPEARVALFLERGVSLLPALLGILKSGAAYVPVDPDYPAARVRFVLADSGVAAVVTSEALALALPPALPVVLASAGEGTPAPVPPAMPAVQAENPAYVIYTSGSTGNPKGVVITHRSVASFFAGMDLHLGPGPGVWLAATSISFDISVLELLWTLTRGFTVVLAEPEAAGELSLADAVERFGVTHFQGTPSRAQMLALDARETAAMRRLDRLLLGGEALPAALAANLFAAGVPEIMNMYGPTETTIWSAVQRVRPGALRIPIGRPILNTDLFVLDGALQPAPQGVVGELYIGGAGVARGYFRQPGLTAERFVPDSLSGGAGTRLYRTGDLARWLPGGELEFMGRVDHQVKVRGYRIEPGEVEAVLASHPQVQKAVVVAFAEGAGASHLVAYVVPAEGPAPDAKALRTFLRECLPEPMVPSVFIPLALLPLTPNGKLDAACPAGAGRLDRRRPGWVRRPPDPAGRGAGGELGEGARNRAHRNR